MIKLKINQVIPCFILLPLFFALTSSAQDYDCFYAGRVSTYTVSMPLIENFSFVKVDSITVSGDSIFHFRNIFKEDINCFECVLYCKRPSLFGTIVVKGIDGTYIFLNEKGDSIYLPNRANINDTNFLVKIDSNSFYRTVVISINPVSTLGVSDTEKVFKLLAVDNDGVPTNHNYDGEEIILSKTFGITRGYDFYQFPHKDSFMSYPAAVTLAGISNPDFGVTNLTALEIFDFEIGDEFHYAGGYYSIYAPILYVRKLVTDKVVLGIDSVRYTFFKNEISTGARPPYSDLPRNDTIIEQTTVSQSVYPELQIIPGEPYTRLSSMTDADTKLIQDFSYDFDSCMLLYGEDCSSRIRNYAYKRGLGFTQTILYGDFYCPAYSFGLVYHKKGGISQGTPINFASLAHHIDSILSGVHDMSFDDEVRVINDKSSNVLLEFNSTVDKRLNVCLYNSLGQSLYRQEIIATKGIMVLPVNLSPNNFYLLEVREGSKRNIFKLFR